MTEERAPYTSTLETDATTIAEAPRTPRQRYVTLWLERKALEERDKQLGRELEALEEVLLEEMLAEGVQYQRLGGVTLHINRQLWASPAPDVARPAIVHALEALGMEGFITYNTTTLSGYMRELARDASGKEQPSREEAQAALPPELRDLIAVEERIKIGARRTG